MPRQVRDPVHLTPEERQRLSRLEMLTGVLDASMFRVSSTKLRILEEVGRKPRSAVELSRIVGVHRTAVHRHLRTLADAGLVTRIQVGKVVTYDIAPKGQHILES